MKAKIRIARLLQYLLFFIPVKKNRIMFYANNRKGYVCNPSVLMESFWLKHPGEYELIWVTRFPETCTMRTGITVVRQRSLSYFKLFLRCGIFITNDMIDEALVKKRGQIFLTTWHGGGAYKKVGKETINEDETFAANFDKWYKRLDYFVSSCQACTDMYAVRPKNLFGNRNAKKRYFFLQASGNQKTCTGLLSYKRADKNFAFCAKFSDDRAGKRAVRFTLFIRNH